MLSRSSPLFALRALRHVPLAVAEHVLEDARAVRRPRAELRGTVEIAGQLVEDRAVVVALDRLLQAAAALRLLAQRRQQRRDR